MGLGLKDLMVKAVMAPAVCKQLPKAQDIHPILLIAGTGVKGWFNGFRGGFLILSIRLCSGQGFEF